ncbi:MAG TPA: zinc-binding dehydrogenase [Enhygromyxa sp.]|nr:zinc-binding dehydrogenase [Enhygromyxa sp.]
MRTLAELARTGAFRPVIDSRYPFERIAEAHARVDSQRKRGSVVVTLS